MDTSPSRLEDEGIAPQLFYCAVAERPDRRLTKAEALAYVRVIRARLHRAESGTEQRRVA